VCRTGAPHVCRELRLYGFDVDGAMAEYVRLPVNSLLRLPNDMSPLVGAVVEPLAVAVHGISLAPTETASTAVVMGAALLTLFLDFGWAAGYTTIVISHIAFEISFIAMTVRARMRGFDWTLEDASMDLGASPTRTFFKVTLPLIIPGIVAAGMLSFALSLDDFIITYFVSGSTVTYPLYVNAAVKAAVPPQINVLATAILLISLILLAVGTLYRRKRIEG